MPDPDPAICLRAIATRDARFDGVFFLGVTSTGIYCRPICSARRPKPENCRFFPHAAAAELAGFRPCRLCCPEQAPGFAPVDAAAALATVAVREIESGALGDGESLGLLADRLGITPRHLRRVVGSHLGVSPVQLAQTQRLLLAKRLLAETRLPIGEIALASGFRSLRRCNALFKSRYGLPPSAFRRASPAPSSETDRLSLFLAYRPPFAWPELMRYFMGRAIPGVEHITPERYARTYRAGPHAGWLAVTHEPSRHGVRLTLSSSLAPALPEVLAAVRRSFDLDASPHAIAAVLGPDPWLAESVRETPGLRLPGAIDAFETAVRTIIGQQVSVAAATTVMGRVVQAFGESLATPWPELNRLTLTSRRLARESVDTLAPLGLNSARARTLLTIAHAIEAGHLTLDRTADPERAIARLQELPGIGPWTAHYFGMRILAWPDAFIAGDLVVKKALAPLTVKQIEARSAVWRPWRGYAVMHLWRAAGFFKNPATPLPP
jgi:AraC family transcriptional regulator of adaptative response / DNA-3-methyladenine glycosylase II